jgi:hypothetical protein
VPATPQATLSRPRQTNAPRRRAGDRPARMERFPDCEYVKRMSKAPRPATTIKFEAMLAAGNEWQVVATFPTAQKKQISWFKSEAEAVAWIGSPRCLAWIKVQGYE